MFSLLAAVQTTGFCAYEFAAKAQNSSAAKSERFLILESIGWVHAPRLANSGGEDYEGTNAPAGDFLLGNGARMGLLAAARFAGFVVDEN